jgi:putative ABC transport system permease protein
MTASAVNLPTIDIRKHKAGYTEKNSLKRTATFVTGPGAFFSGSRGWRVAGLTAGATVDYARFCASTGGFTTLSVACVVVSSTGLSTAQVAQQHASGTPAPLPREQREVTAILVETVSLPGLPAELTAMALKTQINEGRDGQAAEPIREISVLLGLFVRPLELLLLLVTTLVVIVSAIGILVSMVGSSLERSRDVAVMRALGASRGQVLATVLIEAVILALGGGLAGWALGHVLVAAIGPLITTNAGVSATVLSAAPTAELLLVPFLIALAILAALMPALAAYRTDVAKWLG